MLSGKKFVKTALRIIKEKPEMFEALLEFERTGKVPKPVYKKRANFTIDKNILNKFREYCKDKGCNMSKLVEKFMKETVSKKSK